MRVILLADSINVRREQNEQDQNADKEKEERHRSVERTQTLLASLPPELREELIKRTLLDEPHPPALLDEEGRGERSETPP
jgi:hypothetical protein